MSLVERKWVKVRVEDSRGLPFLVIETPIVLPDGRNAIFSLDADLSAAKGPAWVDEQLQEFIRLA